MLPNLIYGLSVYGAYERDVNTVQNFLKRCYKRRYISVPLNVKDIMHMHNKKLFSGARALSHHPLNEILPKPKPQQYNLRRKVCYKRRYISVPLNVKDIMHMHNKKLFSGARALSHHPLNEILPKPKPQQYNLRRKVCSCPKD